MKTALRVSCRSTVRFLILAAIAVACGNKGDSTPPPARPYTGAPVAFEVKAVKKDGLDVRAYNFSDKGVAQYSILMRYYDSDGQVIKTKPGTAFEKDFDFWSMSGKHYLIGPKSWASFEIDHLEVPEGAVKAEVLVRSVTALASDGMHFEKEPLFELPGGMEWPAPPAK